MLEPVEQYCLDVLEERRVGPLAELSKLPLLAFSWLYRAGSDFRNLLYRKGLLSRYTPPVSAVISIGNIVAGGTGKTPLTLLLGTELAKQYPVSILLRGYRAQAEELDAPIAVSTGDGPKVKPHIAGDEAYLIARRSPKLSVFVGKNRVAASEMASKAGARIIIMDDGFQHHSLTRDFDVVMIDAEDPFGKNHFLPRGYLREHPKALKRADLIIVNHVTDDTLWYQAVKKLAPLTSAPLVGVRPKVTSFEGEASVESIAGVRVALLSGIAKPSRFKALVLELSAEIVLEKYALNHTLPSPEEIQAFATKAKEEGAALILCTEKDWVKLPASFQTAIPIISVNIGLEVVEGKEHLEQFLTRVLQKVGQS